MAKHFDNKANLIAEMRRTQAESKKVKDRADAAISATFKAYMLLGAETLYTDLGFREKRLQTWINGVFSRIEQYQRGELSVAELEQKLFDEAGVIVEGPRKNYED